MISLKRDRATPERLSAKRVIRERQEDRRLYERDRPWQHARVMATLVLKARRDPAASERLLLIKVS